MKMSKILKIIFNNRFCFGWISGMIYLTIIHIFTLYNWYQFIPICIACYLYTRYIAFKYFDK